MCEIIRAVGCKVIFILPDDFHPECDVPERLRQQAITCMEPAIADEGVYPFRLWRRGLMMWIITCANFTGTKSI